MRYEDCVRAAFAGIHDHYQTHRPVLREALLRVPSGLILELGAGDGSTHALHAVSQTGRSVITVENDEGWFARYAQLQSENHQLVRVASWADLDAPIIRSMHYAVAFVDHAPADRRVIDIAWLAHQARVVVVHDTECPDYGFDKIEGLFRYKTTYKDHMPWTSAFSNFVDVTGWKF